MGINLGIVWQCVRATVTTNRRFKSAAWHECTIDHVRFRHDLCRQLDASVVASASFDVWLQNDMPNLGPSLTQNKINQSFYYIVGHSYSLLLFVNRYVWIRNIQTAARRRFVVGFTQCASRNTVDIANQKLKEKTNENSFEIYICIVAWR